MEAVFATARDAESDAEEYLVDEGWKAVDVESETVAVRSREALPAGMQAGRSPAGAVGAGSSRRCSSSRASVGLATTPGTSRRRWRLNPHQLRLRQPSP